MAVILSHVHMRELVAMRIDNAVSVLQLCWDPKAEL